MANRYLAVDIEIAALIPDDSTDWKQFRPLGITCAAIAWMQDSVIVTDPFCGEEYDKEKKPRMDRYDCKDLVWILQGYVKEGYTLLTHNGVSFDFDILAEESGMHAECVELAMGSVDTCLQIHCIKGFAVGLSAICKGLGLPGKTEGMDGAKAPQMWHDGEYDKVLEYVAQDARITLEVALATERAGGLHWITQKGKRNWLRVPRWLTTREALRLPEPNVSWMDSPRSRESFLEWMNKSPG